MHHAPATCVAVAATAAAAAAAATVTTTTAAAAAAIADADSSAVPDREGIRAALTAARFGTSLGLPWQRPCPYGHADMLR